MNCIAKVNLKHFCECFLTFAVEQQHFEEISHKLSCLLGSKSWFSWGNFFFELRTKTKTEILRMLSQNLSYFLIINFNRIGIKINCAKHQFCQIAKCQMAFFVNLVIQELKFWKIAQLFIVSVSLVGGFFEETRENTHIPCLGRNWVYCICCLAQMTSLNQFSKGYCPNMYTVVESHQVSWTRPPTISFVLIHSSVHNLPKRSNSLAAPHRYSFTLGDLNKFYFIKIIHTIESQRETNVNI